MKNMIVDFRGWTELSFDEWWDTFEPMENIYPDSQMLGENEYGYCFETYGQEYDCVLFMLAFFPEHIWTRLEVDGSESIANGHMYINRVCYYITKKPVPKNTDYQVNVDY